ncbi:spore germination protein [Neobacillus sp. C211]|uniref:spore germination protein n=1 Tax=unclassified Neobacillus TaxID=2675272 RepID=UPI00397CF813
MVSGQPNLIKNSLLSSSLIENIASIKNMFESCEDIEYKHMDISNVEGCLIYHPGMVDLQLLTEIESHVVTINEHHTVRTKQTNQNFIKKNFLFINVKHSNSLSTIVEQLLLGNTILLIDNEDQAYLLQTAKYTGRAITEAVTERTVRGPREGFIEDLDTNLALVRKRIRTPQLKVKFLTLGRQTNTKIGILYMAGIASEEIVQEIKDRLSKIDIDGILDSQYIESLIQDSKRSPFPTIYNTDRPDKVCGSLLDGKVAIIIDGSPFVLTAPALFVEFLHTSQDYYDSSLAATMVRWVRFLGLFVTLILPAFYVALTTFHPDLLQTTLLLRIAGSREGLPYPVLIEAIFMLMTYELIREAGLRMPKTFGSPIIITLALVIIGQAAVQAGIIGSVLSIVVSITALTSFIMPNYAFHQIIRMLGIPLLILAGLFGFMGILVGLMFGLTHVISLRSFGVPYFSPVSPAIYQGWKDVFIRAPWWGMKSRIPGININNFHRSGEASSSSSVGSKEKKDE